MYIMIIGCGRVGSELAKLLTIEGHDVVVLDKRDSSFQRLGDAFNGITIKGSGVSAKVLQDAGIEKTDIFCALTNSDNINIMACQVAKGIFKVPRVIARVYDPQKATIYKTLGLNVLNETTLFASMLRDKITDKMFSSFLIETRELGVLEFPTSEKLIGRKISEVNIPEELNVTAIRRGGRHTIIPRPETVLNKQDIVVAVVKMGLVSKIKKQFDLEGL